VITEKVLNKIKEIEESGVCKTTAYKCPAGKWTYGWGETEGCYEGATITVKDADAKLFKRVQKIVKYVQKIEPALALRLNEGQWCALILLIYNIGNGVEGFTKSTIRKELAKAEWDRLAITTAWKMWNKITVLKDGIKTKVTCNGLVSRRKKELALFFEPNQA